MRGLKPYIKTKKGLMDNFHCIKPIVVPWWREKESNLRPPGYGPGKLPLLYPAINIAILNS